MHILRALATTLFAYLINMLVIIVVALVAYLIMPAPTVLIIYGAGVALVAVLAFLAFLFAVLVLLLMPYDGRILLEKPSGLSDDISKKVAFLRANGFKYVGIFEDPKRKDNGHTLVFLHQSRTVTVQVKGYDKPDSVGNMEISTYWKPGYFVLTEQTSESSVQMTINHKGKRATKIMLAPDQVVYQQHLGQVKDFAKTLGKPIQVKSPDHFIELERATVPYQKEDGALAIARMMSPHVIRYGLLGLLIVTSVVSFNSLLFGVLVEGMSIFKLSIVSFVILGLMQVVQRFTPKDDKQKNKARKKSAIDDEIQDLLADMDA